MKKRAEAVGISGLSLFLVPPGETPPTESHLHNRQADKHKCGERVDVKMP